MLQTGRLFLGIEGGGTRTVALLANEKGEPVGRITAGPANLKLLSDKQLLSLFRQIASALARPSSLAIGLAGAWTEADWKRIRRQAARAWPRVPCYATNDLETALVAADDHAAPREDQKVLVVSGTGSCCYGKKSDGSCLKVGGWGHLLGDKGSAYEIGLRALKASLYSYDQSGSWPPLGTRILGHLQLNEPNELIGWAQAATKTEIAGLAVEVLRSWEHRDKISTDILAAAANSLARDAATCARRLGKASTRTHFILAGSVLTRQPRFSARVRKELLKLRPNSFVSTLRRESVWGAVELARRAPAKPKPGSALAAKPALSSMPEKVVSTRQSPTETRNPHSMNLDRMSLGKAIQLMLRDDSKLPRRILAQRASLEWMVRAIVKAFKTGGRLFYVGAGTSGRLGVLDASECPPTFRTPPELVQGIIAGGQTALWRSIEGAEDDMTAGANSVRFRSVCSKDVVIGIAASGTTPYVWGALREARARRAKTALVCFNPFLSIPRSWKPDVIIAPNLGPEILTGSTRLKAGTATKLILNIFTTLAMARSGKVISNLMVDLLPVNVKLRDRATRIVQELTGVSYASARLALEKSEWVIKRAVARIKQFKKGDARRYR
jgi:N-acetylmuramic acid 6-phosphate etherase